MQRNTKALMRLVEMAISRRQLSQNARIHYGALCNILNGRIVPSASEKRRIARALGVEVVSIFPDEPITG